eukprot:15365678-Ditylum_brightwellii.AAC.1
MHDTFVDPVLVLQAQLQLMNSVFQQHPFDVFSLSLLIGAVISIAPNLSPFTHGFGRRNEEPALLENLHQMHNASLQIVK